MDRESYLDCDDAWLIALTRQRRAEAKARRLTELAPTIRYHNTDVPRVAVYTRRRGKVYIRMRVYRDKQKADRWFVEQWEQGNRTCTYCYVALTRERRQPNTGTVDHKEPLAPGNDEPWNYAMACGACNLRKDRMPEAAFRALICEELASGLAVAAA